MSFCVFPAFSALRSKNDKTSRWTIVARSFSIFVLRNLAPTSGTTPRPAMTSATSRRKLGLRITTRRRVSMASSLIHLARGLAEPRGRSRRPIVISLKEPWLITEMRMAEELSQVSGRILKRTDLWGNFNSPAQTVERRSVVPVVKHARYKQGLFPGETIKPRMNGAT